MDANDVIDQYKRWMLEAGNALAKEMAKNQALEREARKWKARALLAEGKRLPHPEDRK